MPTLKKTSNNTNNNAFNKYLIAGLIVLSLLIYHFVTPSTSALKTPIENQLSAIQEEDLVSAYSYTTKEFQKKTSLEAFKRFVNDYSGLRNNQNIKFNERNIENGIGTVKATLLARGGIPTAVTYQLVKERNQWRIDSMLLVPSTEEPQEPEIDSAPPSAIPVSNVAAAPTSAATPVSTMTKSETSTATPTTTIPTAATTNTSTASVATNATAQQFSDTNYHYAMQYPASWDYTRADRGITVFFKNDHQESHNAQLTIQPLEFDENAGHQSVKQVMDLGENAIKEKDNGYKIVEDGLLPSRANKNENFHGRYIVYSYTINNESVKQLQVIYFKSPTRAQFVIDFISPEGSFDADLPSVRAMIASFTISS